MSEGFRNGVRLWECMKTTNSLCMKIRPLLAVLPILALSPVLTFAQSQPRPPVPGGGIAVNGVAQPPAAKPDEKPFTLNFKGGPVEEFVKAVETASGEPFNVIIPNSAQDLVIPPVRVREVTLSPLLGALSASSREQKPVIVNQSSQGGRSPGMLGSSSIQYQNTGFAFSPTPGSGGSGVWQLTVEKVQQLPELPASLAPRPIAHFYQLKPHLEAGLKIEDITTVAETAWKMMKLDAKDIPNMKVHEETGLLIAVGTESALSVIDSVLKELPRKETWNQWQRENRPPAGGPQTQPLPPGPGASPAPVPIPQPPATPRAR
jgi:hypothetical protein